MVTNADGVPGFIILLSGIIASQTGSAETIPWGYRKIAAAHGIPPSILYAVAKTESNYRLVNGADRPWPWTLNVQGRPERYSTRRAAYGALKRYLNRGISRIDIGLMQVNWHYHHTKLGSPWQALAPYHNLRIGSRILTTQYAGTHDWLTAVGRYHAPGNPKRAKIYRQRVAKHLRRIRSQRDLK